MRVRLREDGLLVGFARRVASYKRSDLILRRPDRAIGGAPAFSGRLQIAFAGKAHPADEHGRQILTNLVQLARQLLRRRWCSWRTTASAFRQLPHAGLRRLAQQPPATAGGLAAPAA
jgi:hypothetical protein